MKRILESVPNFSEGVNKTLLQELSNVTLKYNKVKVLHKDSGQSANRTVFTLAGDPDELIEALFDMIEFATENIDMNMHKGIHPCFGATDVVPLIPVKGVSVLEAIEYCKHLSERVARELKLPVYLYESAANESRRQSLFDLRRGGYFKIKERIRTESLYPDYGESKPHPTAGAVAIGVRKIMIAYNVNLACEDVNIAKDIAEEIRESGYRKKLADGSTIHVEGKFKKVKAIGWMIPEFKKVQVSMNLMDIEVTPLHVVFNAIKELALERNTKVTGSELVGLIPLSALEETALSMGMTWEGNAKEVIKYLGLNDVKPFDKDSQILELALTQQNLF